jgi:hypothetical protein
VAGTCGYGEELSGSINVGNFLTSCKVTVSFSRRTLLHGVVSNKGVIILEKLGNCCREYTSLNVEMARTDVECSFIT